MRRTQRKKRVLKMSETQLLAEQLSAVEFFKQRFQFLKLKAVAFISDQEKMLPQTKEKKQKRKQKIYLTIACSDFKDTIRNMPNPVQKYYSMQQWIFTDITTKQQFFNIEDAIQTISLTNEITNELNLQVTYSSILSILTMLSALPFVKGIKKITITYSRPSGRDGNLKDICFSKLLNSDDHFRDSFISAIKLSIKMILSMKSLEKLTIQGEGQIFGEALAEGIAEFKINPINSSQLSIFTASQLFQNLSERTTFQVLKTLSSLKHSLVHADIGRVNLGSVKTVNALNQLLQIVKIIVFNIGELVNEKIVNHLKFGRKYDLLNLSFSCDELRHPKIYDKLFSILGEIQSVKIVYLNNLFNLDSIQPTRVTTVFKDIYKIRDILPGSLVLEKLFQEQLQNEDNKLDQDDTIQQHQVVNSFRFFERLVGIKLNSFYFSGMISRRSCETFLNFLRNCKCTSLQLQQNQPHISNPLGVPLQIKKIYEQESNIDLGDLYEIWTEQPWKNVDCYTKIGHIKLQFQEIILNLLESKQLEIKFDPLRFERQKLQRVTINASISDLPSFEQIFEQTAGCPQLEFLEINVQFGSLMRKQITYNTLHKKSQEQISQPFKYLSQLDKLTKLKNVILNLDVDQIIVDSITQLIQNTNSLKTLIFRRKELTQYYLDFSGMIQAINSSSSLTHVLLDCQLENIPIISPNNRLIYETQILNQFYLPISELLKNSTCRLFTLEIVERDVQKQGMEDILESMIQRKNKVVLNVHHSAFTNSIISREVGSLYHQAISKNLMVITNNCIDTFKFI